ncbi:MAG: hypothetical protein ABW221_12965 [Vicinamibacteria bacterium]
MKKVLGVVMAAVLPMACGTIPTAPTGAPASDPVEAAAFTSSARGIRTCSEKADWSVVRGVVVSVARRGRGSVTVRAEPVYLGDIQPLPCHTTSFLVKPAGRGITLTRELDPREATLRAPNGAYAIQATVEGAAKPAYSGSVQVQLPDGK